MVHWSKHHKDLREGKVPNTQGIHVPQNARTLYYADTTAYPKRQLEDAHLYSKHLKYVTPWNMLGFDWVSYKPSKWLNHFKP
jgi:hypothetical protein